MFKLITIFILVNLNILYAFDYYSSANLGAYDVSTTSDFISTGYFKQEFSDDKFALHANLWLNSPETLYDFSSSAATFNMNVDLYSVYNISYNTFYVGYMNSVASKNFMYNILGRKQLFLGVNVLNNRDSLDTQILPDAYMNNESAFSFSYLYGALDNNLYLGFSYTPNLSSTIGTDSSLAVYENAQSVLDSVLIYYNEYSALGYGLRLASRVYTYDTYYDQKSTLDLSGTMIIDYLGFSLEAGVMSGERVYDDFSDNMEYTSFESSLSYSFGAWSTGVYMINSKINTTDNLLLEYEVFYNINAYTNVNIGFTYEDLEHEVNQGVLIGLSVMY